MTHPNFWDIYMYLINQGISLRVKTNGLLLTGRNIECFTEYPPYLIDVSLYGCDKQSYIAVTGVDAYQKVIDNIHVAIEKGLQLRIMITPNSFMMPWIEQIVTLAKSLGVQVIVNDILLEPNDNTGRHKSDFELNEKESNKIIQIKKNLFQMKLISKGREEYVYENTEKRTHVAEKGLYCNGGRTSFTINWDGTMSPCPNFPRNIVCANPLKNGFRNAWKEINTKIKNYTVPQKCHSCNINTKCHYCPTQHSKVASDSLCDPVVCAYWHKIYK